MARSATDFVSEVIRSGVDFVRWYQEGPREGPGEGPREAPTEGPWEAPREGPL